MENLFVEDNANINGKLFIEKDALFKSNANIYGNTQIDQNLYVLGSANITGNFGFADNIYVTKNANIYGNTQVDQNLYVLGSANITGNFGFADNIYVTKNANIYGNVQIDQNLNILSNVKITDSLLINNKTININSNNLNYEGNTILTIDSNNILNISNLIIKGIVDSDVTLDVRGNVSCDSIYITSNMEKKKNIKEINKEDIENLMKIKSYNYNLKSNDQNYYGFMAHEVKELYPMLSNGDTVNYIGFIPLLLEKIRMLENEIERLRLR